MVCSACGVAICSESGQMIYWRQSVACGTSTNYAHEDEGYCNSIEQVCLVVSFLSLVEPLLGGVMLPLNLGEEPSEPRVGRRSPLVYFLCVVLGLSLLLFAGLHAAGLSPLNIIPLFRRASANDTKVKDRFPKPKMAPLFADTFVDNSSGWNVQS